MANKRIVLKEGFYVDGREIKRCHFSKAVTVDMWGEKSEDYLVMVDGAMTIVSGYKRELYTNLPDAVEKQNERQKEHVEFCKKQVEYYGKQLVGCI